MEIYKMSFVFYLLYFVVFFLQWSSNRGEKYWKKSTLKSPLPLAKFISRNVTLFWNNISILNTFLQVYSKHVCTPCQGILNPWTIQTFFFPLGEPRDMDIWNLWFPYPVNKTKGFLWHESWSLGKFTFLITTLKRFNNVWNHLPKGAVW